MQATRRKPWLAALLSLPLAGLGHLYAGKPRRALGFYVVEELAGLVYLLLLNSWTLAPWNALTGMALYLGWRLIAAVDAYLVTARSHACVGRPAWIRWPAYAIAYLTAFYGPALALHATVFEAFVVPMRSMANTLIPGDRLLAAKWSLDSPARGELVIFKTPADEIFVKRVIGLPGDRVEVRQGIAHVNGVRLEEPYVLQEGSDPGEFGQFEVPAGSYFVLGDNRNYSKDSRVDEIGFVPADRIVARPRAIFFSRDWATGEIRWDRLGRPLQ